MAIGGAETIRRTALEEEADRHEFVQNFLDKKYEDWPNEAGFAGLTEHRGPVKLQVHGTIPSYAAGALYRTGPGVSEFETDERGTFHVSHWFDGFAHTHRFDIAAAPEGEGEGEGGATTVTYSSRRQGQEYIDKIKKRGWRGGITFAQRSDPCIGIYAKATSRFEKAINNNVAVLRNVPGLDKTVTTTPLPAGHHAVTTSNIALTTDATTVQVIDKDTLEAVGDGTQAERFHPDLKGPMAPSHAQRDEETGDLFSVNLAVGRFATYRFFRVNEKSGTTDILATVSEKDVSAAYIHSFFLTQNHVVLCVPSSHLAWGGIKIPWEGNVLDAIKPFDKSRLCQWIVVDRRHGRGVVARFITPAAFFLHSVNAFEETAAEEKDVDGQPQTFLILDYIHFDTTAILYAMYYDVILKRNGATEAFWGDRGTIETMRPRFVRRRFALPAASETTKQTPAERAATATAPEVLSIPAPHVGEMPVINPAYACRPYRYVYSVPARGLSTAIGECLAKTDLETREALLWTGPPGHTPSEAIFVARPGAADEDDGVLLSVVLDGEGRTSYLLCLDAKTMTEMGRAEADFAIALGFHGLHAPAV